MRMNAQREKKLARRSNSQGPRFESQARIGQGLGPPITHSMDVKHKHVHESSRQASTHRRKSQESIATRAHKFETRWTGRIGNPARI